MERPDATICRQLSKHMIYEVAEGEACLYVEVEHAGVPEAWNYVFPCFFPSHCSGWHA